jgi:hypothetical protein
MTEEFCKKNASIDDTTKKRETTKATTNSIVSAIV